MMEGASYVALIQIFYPPTDSHGREHHYVQLEDKFTLGGRFIVKVPVYQHLKLSVPASITHASHTHDTNFCHRPLVWFIGFVASRACRALTGTRTDGSIDSSGALMLTKRARKMNVPSSSSLTCTYYTYLPTNDEYTLRDAVVTILY